VIRKVRIRRFGHVEHNGDDTHWIEHCVTMKVRVSLRGRLMKTWWNSVKEVMESFGLSQEDAWV